MNGSTENQPTKFTDKFHVVMNRFGEQPTEILLAESIIYTNDDPSDLTLRKAAAAAMGYSRAGLYIDAARSLLEQILADAAEISWRKQAYDLFMPILQSRYSLNNMMTEELRADLAAVVSLIEGAKYLSKDAELVWHLYAVCLDRSRYFMENSIRWVDPCFVFTEEEANYAKILRAFRNHLEHRDKALSSVSGADWETFTDAEKDAITIVYRKNIENEVLFYSNDKDFRGMELSMPLNQVGFSTHQNLIERMHNQIKEASLQNLSHHFKQNPNELPDVEVVGTLITDDLVQAE